MLSPIIIYVKISINNIIGSHVIGGKYHANIIPNTVNKTSLTILAILSPI